MNTPTWTDIAILQQRLTAIGDSRSFQQLADTPIDELMALYDMLPRRERRYTVAGEMRMERSLMRPPRLWEQRDEVEDDGSGEPD